MYGACGEEINTLDSRRYERYVAYLLHCVRQGNSSNGDIVALRNNIQDHRDLLLAASHDVGSLTASLLWCGIGRPETTYRLSTQGGKCSRGCNQHTTSQNTPRVNSHALITAHRDNLTLQVTDERRITTLIDRERTQPMLAGIGVGLCDDPSGCVTDTEIQDLALGDQGVEGLHQLRDLSGVVPRMDVVLCLVNLSTSIIVIDYIVGICTYNIDVVSLEVLQAAFNGHVHALGTGSAKVTVLDWLAGHGADGVLGGNDHFGTAASLFHPFADELLALAALIGIGRIDEVSAKVIVGVEELEGHFLGTRTHHWSPGGAQT
jgi:hypothetical protein